MNPQLAIMPFRTGDLHSPGATMSYGRGSLSEYDLPLASDTHSPAVCPAFAEDTGSPKLQQAMTAVGAACAGDFSSIKAAFKRGQGKVSPDVKAAPFLHNNLTHFSNPARASRTLLGFPGRAVCFRALLGSAAIPHTAPSLFSAVCLKL